MLKKTFYTVFALGAMITIGIAASGFVSANTANETTVETAAESETAVAPTFITGVVNQDGTVREAGTGGWTVKKGSLYGTYEIQGPSNAVGITGSVLESTNQSPYVCYCSYVTVRDMGGGKFIIGTAKGSTPKIPNAFSFVMFTK